MVRLIAELPEAKKGNLPGLPYEDLVWDPLERARTLSQFTKLAAGQEVVQVVADAEVVGSSFFDATGRASAVQPNWRTTPLNVDFQPVGRWRQWPSLERLLCSAFAGRELRELGFADNGFK